MPRFVFLGIMMFMFALIPAWQMRVLRNFILFGIFSGIGYLAWNGYAGTQVVSSEEAGSITGAAFTSSYWGQTTAIQTEKGTFLSHGVMQAIQGRPVRIEVRQNGTRKLCDSVTNECLPMADR